jgi:hypothetical protein
VNHVCLVPQGTRSAGAETACLLPKIALSCCRPWFEESWAYLRLCRAQAGEAVKSFVGGLSSARECRRTGQRSRSAALATTRPTRNSIDIWPDLLDLPQDDQAASPGTCGLMVSGAHLETSATTAYCVLTLTNLWIPRTESTTIARCTSQRPQT